MLTNDINDDGGNDKAEVAEVSAITSNEGDADHGDDVAYNSDSHNKNYSKQP